MMNTIQHNRALDLLDHILLLSGVLGCNFKVTFAESTHEPHQISDRMSVFNCITNMLLLHYITLHYIIVSSSSSSSHGKSSNWSFYNNGEYIE